MAYKLDPACPPCEEVPRIVRECLAEALSVGADKRRPLKERVHTARTSCKKARAALRLLRSANPERSRHENRALGEAARELSVLRDADVMLDTFGAALKHYALPREKFRSVRTALMVHRRNVMPKRAEVERILHTFVVCLRKIDRRFEGWQSTATFSELMNDFGRTYRSARHALQEVQTAPSADAFHEWRKATKAFSYQCRLLRSAWPSAMKELGAALKQLGSLLGDEHDLTVIRGHLRRLAHKDKLEAENETQQAIVGLVTSRREELRAEAILLGERLFADKPKAVVARLTRWWQVTAAHPAPPLAA